MDISFYTLANAVGITCAAAAFLFFLRRTARSRQEEDEDRDERAAQPAARPGQPHGPAMTDAGPAHADAAQTGQAPCAGPETGDEPTPGKRP